MKPEANITSGLGGMYLNIKNTNRYEKSGAPFTFEDEVAFPIIEEEIIAIRDACNAYLNLTNQEE